MQFLAQRREFRFYGWFLVFRNIYILWKHLVLLMCINTVFCSLPYISLRKSWLEIWQNDNLSRIFTDFDIFICLFLGSFLVHEIKRFPWCTVFFPACFFRSLKVREISVLYTGISILVQMFSFPVVPVLNLAILGILCQEQIIKMKINILQHKHTSKKLFSKRNVWKMQWLNFF